MANVSCMMYLPAWHVACKMPMTDDFFFLILQLWDWKDRGGALSVGLIRR